MSVLIGSLGVFEYGYFTSVELSDQCWKFSDLLRNFRNEYVFSCLDVSRTVFISIESVC